MNAIQFINHWKNINLKNIPPDQHLGVGHWRAIMEAYARYYHRAKVEGVTDEEISVMCIKEGSREVGFGALSQSYLRKGAKWVRDKLLNQ